jgi:hypothetical protein
MKNTLLYYFDYFTSWLDFSWFITLPKRKDAINDLPPCYKEQEDKRDIKEEDKISIKYYDVLLR